MPVAYFNFFSNEMMFPCSFDRFWACTQKIAFRRAGAIWKDMFVVKWRERVGSSVLWLQLAWVRYGTWCWRCWSYMSDSHALVWSADALTYSWAKRARLVTVFWESFSCRLFSRRSFRLSTSFWGPIRVWFTNKLRLRDKNNFFLSPSFCDNPTLSGKKWSVFSSSSIKFTSLSIKFRNFVKS